MTSPYSVQADRRGPPMKSTETSAGASGPVTATATSTSAAELDVLGAAFTCSAYYSFQAVGADVYMLFKAATSATGITTSNAPIIPANTIQEWLLTPEDRFMEHVASAAGTIRRWRSSPR